MKKTLLRVGWMVLAATAPAAAEGTARDGLPTAMQRAVKWQSDAGLIRIGATKADVGGKALVWEYQFYSPKKKECFRVVLLEGNIYNVFESGECTSGKPVSTEFVDSPVAMQEARKAGFHPDPDGENTMAFHRSKDRLAKGKECWSMHTVSDFDRAKAVMRGWCVDGKTGKFVTRESGYY